MDADTQQTVPRRFRRRGENRLIGGVAGGLADYTGIDPIYFRIGFVLLTLAGGTGILLYALACVFVPERGRDESIGLSLLGRIMTRRALAILLLGIAALLLFGRVQFGYIDWGLLWPIALITIGFVLLRDDVALRDHSVPETPTTVAATDAPAVEPRTKERHKRPRSPLTFMTLGAACVAVALATLVESAGIMSLNLGRYLALALTIVGGGLVVGAWWGRSWFLIVVAVLLTPVVFVTSIIDVPIRGEITNRYISLDRQVNDKYQMLAGTLTLDFSEFKFKESTTAVDISFFGGNVDVFVPPGVDVQVRGELDLGVADLFGKGFKGDSLEFAHSFLRPGLTDGRLILNVDGGIGSFDATWADWTERNKRFQRRSERRAERKKEQGDGRNKKVRNRG